MSDAAIAVVFALAFWFVLVPLFVFVVFSFLDIFWRQDLGGWGKLTWAVVQLAVPVLGLLAYWLVRPKTLEVWQPGWGGRALSPR
jgi:hypothetical protein